MSGQLLDPFRFGDGCAPADGPDRDGLQVLGPHDRPQACGADGLILRQQGGLGNQVLAGWAYADCPHFIAQLTPQHRHRVDGPAAPQAGGIPQLGPALFDEEVTRLRQPPAHEQCIVPGRSEPGAPVPSQVAV